MHPPAHLPETNAPLPHPFASGSALLTNLNLQYNSIGVEGAKAIAAVLPRYDAEALRMRLPTLAPLIPRKQLTTPFAHLVCNGQCPVEKTKYRR
jgi:hypothetical protein